VRDWFVTRYPESLWQVAVTLAIVASSVAIALLARLAWRFIFLPIARRTPTNADRLLLERTEKPVSIALVCIGAHVAMQRLVRIPPFDQGFTAHIVEESVGVLLVLAAALVANAALAALLTWYLTDIASRTQNEVDQHVARVIGRVLRVLILFIAATIIMGHFNIKMGAVLGAAGVASLAVALAAQDTVANMISGFMILFDRPFRIGDRIELANGRVGDVCTIGFRSTRIRSLDNRILVIPNSELSKLLVINHSEPDASEVVRLPLAVAYGTDPQRVKDLVNGILAAQSHVLPEPAPGVHFTSFGDSALQFLVVFHIDDFRERIAVVDAVHTRIAATFAAAGIKIPFPQRDVNIRSGGAPLHV